MSSNVFQSFDMQIRIKGIFIALLILSGCPENSGSPDSSKLDNEASTTPPTEQMLANRHKCMSCHQLTANALGPSIKDISMKHKNTDINELVATVKAGRGPGELTWGYISKQPSQLSKEEIKQVIEWMLMQ
jgi:cytochrome c551/c552